MKKSSSILDVHIACPTQAGDIALISPSSRNMQDMLLMCEKYSSKWRFTFSSKKNQIINFSREHDACFSLYNKQLPKTTSIKHVGIKLHANFDHWERTAETCRSIKSTSMVALFLSGCHPHGLSPVTSLKLVKTLCLAKSLYGCELWNALSKNELLALERAFRFSIKNIQGLPKRTRTNICLGLTGTTSIESIIDMHKLYFLDHVLRTLTWTLVYKVITSRLLCFKNKCVQTSLGFISDIHRIMCKYQLLNHLTEFLIRQDLSSPDICHFLKLHPNVKMHRAWHISRLNPLLKEQAHHVIRICASWRPHVL